jgi:hypothetical protein
LHCDVVKKGYNGFGRSYFLYWVVKKVAYTKKQKIKLGTRRQKVEEM